MAYKITSKSNYYNPQVEPGVVIDDSGNIFLNNLTARDVVLADSSPQLGENQSFIVSGGGFANAAPHPVGLGLNSATGSTNPPLASPVTSYGDHINTDFVTVAEVSSFPYSNPGNASNAGDITPTGMFAAATSQSQSHGFVAGGSGNNVTFPHGDGGWNRYRTAQYAQVQATTGVAINPSNYPGYKDDMSREVGGTNFVAGNHGFTGGGAVDSSNPRVDDMYLMRTFDYNKNSSGPKGGSPFYDWGRQWTWVNALAGGYQAPSFGAPSFQPYSTRTAGMLTVPGHGGTHPQAIPAPSFRKGQTTTERIRYAPDPLANDYTSANNKFFWEFAGYNSDVYEEIHKFPFASVSAHSDVGELSIETTKSGGHSSVSHGYVSGGVIKAFPNPKATFVPYNVDYSNPKYPDGFVPRSFQPGQPQPNYSEFGLDGSDLELSYITDRVQRYPFAISSATAENVGSLGIFQSVESQNGYIPPSYLNQPEHPDGVNGRVTFYNRYNHAAVSSETHGYLVGGMINGVVVNKPEGEDLSITYATMSTTGYPYLASNERYFIGPNSNNGIPAISVPNGKNMNHLGYAPYHSYSPLYHIITTEQLNEKLNNGVPTPYVNAYYDVEDNLALQADLVNSDIIKFSYSNNIKATSVGQLEHMAFNSSPVSAPIKAFTAHDDLSAVSGVDAMYIHHHNRNHADLNFQTPLAAEATIHKFPFANLTGASMMITDLGNPPAGGHGGRTATGTAFDGFFSGGSGFNNSTVGTGEGHSIYHKQIDKFPFSLSSTTVTDIGDLAVYHGTKAGGIND